MPWYVVLGSSASGKTALSLGLSATVAEDGSDDTTERAARFHISDEAVLVELNGAFFQQDEAWARRLWPRILDHLRGALSSFKLPRAVLFFAAGELEYTASHKLKLPELRALALERLLASGIDEEWKSHLRSSGRRSTDAPLHPRAP